MASLKRSAAARRVGVVGAAAVLALATATPAQAGQRDSFLSQVLPSFESTRWTDDGGTGPTKIHFTSCTASATFSSTDVIMWEDISFLPDANKGKKRFTACKKAGSTSKGNWPAMSNGDKVYFEIDAVNGSKGQVFLSVKTVKIAY